MRVKINNNNMEYRKEKVKGYEEYQVDTNGIVYSKKGKPLKYSLNNNGYCIINFYIDGKAKGFAIHTIVAKQFIQNNNPERMQINHKDGNKTNNCVDNLEWVTRSENMQHSVNVLKNHIGSKNGNAKAIKGYDKITGDLKYSFNSIMDCAKYICGNNNARHVQNSIYRVLSGRSKSYKGCVWEYADLN